AGGAGARAVAGLAGRRHRRGGVPVPVPGGGVHDGGRGQQPGPAGDPGPDAAAGRGVRGGEPGRRPGRAGRQPTAADRGPIGRDVLNRFLAGGRTLLLLALIATLLGVGLGAAVGVVAAYRRGWRDEVLMRGCDVVLAFPQVIIALLFVSMLGPKLWLLVLVVAASHAPRTARVVRGAALGVVERDFVAAAR